MPAGKWVLPNGLAESRASMAEDLGYAFSGVHAFEAAKLEEDVSEEDLVLIGHSAGG